jgi:hypothetical protein
MSRHPGFTLEAGNARPTGGKQAGWLRRAIVTGFVAATMLAAPLAHDAIPHDHPEMAHGLAVGVAEAAASLSGQPCPTSMHHASRWHPPVDPRTGCTYGHEHGDAPPAWVQSAGYSVGFDHAGGFHGNTSVAENTTKHSGMKGFLADFTDYNGGTQQAYFRVHIASNPLDRSARYHSYEVFMRDAAGGVSHWQGWFNSGDPKTDRVVYNGANDPGRRPIVLVQDESTFPKVKNEHWYMRATAPWNWDFAWTVDATTFHDGEETGDTGAASWKPTGRLGTVRRFEPAWYGPDSKIAPARTNAAPKGGIFFATQFGEIVSGPTAPRCSGSTTMYGTTYRNECLPQFIATTARAVEHLVPGGTPRERVFPGIGLGVKIPN